jgi:hypothetical protein
VATYDLGDPVALGVTVTNTAGAVANTTTMVCTITLPDGTTATPSVTNSGTGLYDITYIPVQAGRFGVRWVATGTNACAFTDTFEVNDPTVLGVVSLQDAKDHLNITTTTNDEELRRFLWVATDLCEQYAGRVLGRKTVTDIFDGGSARLRLRHPVALSVTTVVENGVTLDAASYRLDATTGMFVERVGSNGLISFGGMFSGSVDAITVTYVAGFQIVPPTVQQAVLEALRHLWQTQRGASSVSALVSSGDDYTPGMSFSLPRRVMELLGPWTLAGVA